MTDRRRLVVAAAFTIVALPAIWLFTRGEATTSSGAPSIAAAGIESPRGDAATAVTDVDTMGSNGPIFINGPTTPPKPAVIQIVVPAQVEGEYTEGGATYKSSLGPDPTTCSAPGAPFGALLTVTNRDNGKSITCVNRTQSVLGAGLAITLTSDQFVNIGQQVDAPIPVRITWQGAG